jgi:hypothetical protein
MVVGVSLLPSNDTGSAGPTAEPQNRSGYDPPVSTGMRGSHSGSFETAHSLRDGTFWGKAGQPVELHEKYDPQEPILLHFSRTPCKPGLPVRDQQVAGWQEIQATAFETYERTPRDQLQRTLQEGGFDLPGK